MKLCCGNARFINDVEVSRHQKILMRIQNYSFVGEHIAGKDNRICDALSRLCRMVTETHHYPLPTTRNLNMKQLAILDPLVIHLAAAGEENATYVCMLNDIEKGVQGKDLDETSE